MQSTWTGESLTEICRWGRAQGKIKSLLGADRIQASAGLRALIKTLTVPREDKKSVYRNLLHAARSSTTEEEEGECSRDQQQVGSYSLS